MASGSYALIGRVASTATGGVWKARDTALDRVVALKELPDAAALAHEASVLATLHSDHVVAVFGVVSDGGRSFLVEEWVEGATLAAVLRGSGPLSTSQALGLARGALLGLADAHRAGLVHGDVSLSNIMIAVDGSAKLIDFGSAVRTGDLARRATAAFRAPEVVAGERLTPAADVYSAAAVITMLMTGDVSPRASTRGIEASVRAVLDVALATDPAARYPDAAAFLAALEAAAVERYGIGWWTQSGLGALATSAATALVTTGLAGGPFGGAGAVAGAGSTGAGSTGLGSPGAADALARPVSLTSERRIVRAGLHGRKALIGTSIGVTAAVAVGVALLVSSGDGDKPTPAAARSSITIPTQPAPTVPVQTPSATSSAAPTTTTLHHATATVRYKVIKNDPQTPLASSGTITFHHTYVGQRVSTDGTLQIGTDDNKQASGNSLQLSGTLPVGTYSFTKGRGSPADAFGAMSVRARYVDASFNQNTGGGEVFVGGFGQGAPSAETCTATVTRAGASGVAGSIDCPRVSIGGGEFVAALHGRFSFTP